MPDIFISYSSKDREQAQLLTELLASAGLSVWIDQAGIEAATSWSEEIVNALDGCKAFIVMLSPSSIESKNVVREVALAFEKNKKILPLDLEPVSLPASMQYHLAGLQRTSMTNIDAVIRALGKLGLAATGAPQAPKIVKETDGRKSLMILPFEDLSPAGDNGWFADGIASELITALTNVKAIRIADQQATKDYKRYTGTLPAYARETAIRYFVQGDVRKFGDSIKITARLLDIETGDHLWQDSLKGTMEDIFDIQEKVAEKVVDGLKVHLASDEKNKLSERGTENAEAYELSLKAADYFHRLTENGLQLAIKLLSDAIDLDPKFAKAYSTKANVLASLYLYYNRIPSLLEDGLNLIQAARKINPDLWAVYHPLSIILMLQGKHAEAEAAAQEYIQKAPEEFMSHFALGFFYMETGQNAKAIAPFEEALKRKPEYLISIFNLVLVCHNANEAEKRIHWAEVAIPLFEKRLKLFPENETNRVHHAVLLYFAGRYDDSRAAVAKLDNLKDGLAIYNTSSLLCMLEDYSAGLRTFHNAIVAGYRNLRSIKLFLADEGGIGRLKGTPEWDAAIQIVEQIEQEEPQNNE
jgi:adenylate cyclase